MLDIATIDKIAAKAAGTAMRKQNLSSVVSAPSADSDGRDALQVTIIVKSAAPEMLDGDTVLELMVEIQRALRAAGEERFAFIDFATEQELREDAGS